MSAPRFCLCTTQRDKFLFLLFLCTQFTIFISVLQMSSVRRENTAPTSTCRPFRTSALRTAAPSASFRPSAPVNAPPAHGLSSASDSAPVNAPPAHGLSSVSDSAPVNAPPAHGLSSASDKAPVNARPSFLHFWFSKDLELFFNK